ncbi:MAG: HPF/RaiA family ribosome-associated protein [Deltaproteobacteria bacterium]|nr:HPF/RaiA family ribosome-associated protein [Deltaproteobacteria bacterium]
MVDSLQITFKEMAPSAALEARIREHAAKLGRFHPDPMTLRVVVSCPHQHHLAGKRFHVALMARVRGHELVANRTPDEHHAYVDPYIAVHDAFHALRRVLMEHARVRRGDTKLHEPTPHGVVVSLFPEDGYGVLATPDERDIYFHRNSVVNGSFDEVHVGTQVRYAEETGEQGPQASSVFVLKNA